jgi:two-component system phosphate regulon sensor histidine kinase PhoR
MLPIPDVAQFGVVDGLAIGLAVGCLVALRRVRLQWRMEAARNAQLTATLALREQETARAAAALAGASDGLIVIGGDGIILACNPNAVEFASLPESATGRRLADLVPWPALARAVADAESSGVAQYFEIETPTAGGRTLAVRVRPLPGHGIVVALDDTSRLKKLESLRRDFVANVSHELKTPLAAIQGYVETMQDDPEMPTPTRVRFLDRIARQTERLTTLVGDLLTLSRLDDEGAIGRELRPIDLGAVVRETVKDLASLADKRQVRLAMATPEAGVWVRGDREALRQVVGNLVDNAIKYTGAGGDVRAQLTVTADRALLEVVDTGLGLSPEDQERVFERFYRVDRARSREVGGTGLGLSIVKNTVKSLGGEVGVRSRLGSGSTFWVSLPVVGERVPADDDAA